MRYSTRKKINPVDLLNSEVPARSAFSNLQMWLSETGD